MAAKLTTRPATVLLLLLAPVALLLTGCGLHQGDETKIFRSPPLLTDDTDRQSLITAVQHQLNYLKRLPADYQADIDGRSYSRKRLVDSLTAFLTLIHKELTPDELRRRLMRDFSLIRAGGRAGTEGEMLVTGYYLPLFAASLDCQAPYSTPVYQRPKSLIVSRDQAGNTSISRLNGAGQKVPFWTRAEIEGPARPLAGDELACLKDPFEAFLLHIQGSGLIELPDSSRRLLAYDANNGHPYRSIGRLLVDEGKMTLEASSIPAIRHYLDHHPEELSRVLHHNPRYIFFRLLGEEAPRGSLGLPLTGGRSVAIDRDTLPDTMVAWLETTVPVLDDKGEIVTWRNSGRFVRPQDSGSAITGTGRVDLFLGSGQYAETAAGTMRQPGRLYFLVKK